MASPFDHALSEAEGRIGDQERAREIVRDKPAVAKQLGIGRPDILDARGAGGFASVEDVGAALDLDPVLVEGLRAQAVLLPRSWTTKRP